MQLSCIEHPIAEPEAERDTKPEPEPEAKREECPTKPKKLIRHKTLPLIIYKQLNN